MFVSSRFSEFTNPPWETGDVSGPPGSETSRSFR